ncbi:MAG: DUF1273 domain-containing protein [Clostridiales bacterium]|nr:DUF1273 domain-containing protein [Clostridiales bacterium]
MEREKTCCFTGHRPQNLGWKQTEPDLRRVLMEERLALEVERAYLQGYRHFITGMARGSDLLAAEAVLRAKFLHPDIWLEAAVPCKDQSRRWPRAEQERYERILARCDQTPACLPDYDEGCMMRRNRYMVEQSSRIIAIYNGRSGGGTKKTLLMAVEAGLDIIILDPEDPMEGA